MHATKVAAILAFCAAQGLAAPVNVVGYPLFPRLLNLL